LHTLLFLHIVLEKPERAAAAQGWICKIPRQASGTRSRHGLVPRRGHFIRVRQLTVALCDARKQILKRVADSSPVAQKIVRWHRSFPFFNARMLMMIRIFAGVLFSLFSSAVFAQWELLPGLATDIGVGARGDAMVVGVDQVEGGHSLYRWIGSDWQIVPGGAVRI